ncbi:lyase family protein [Alkalihalobacillus oceani]|uniref:lyase family protein n=1 Tax=Halalkalibacter oceani TaxID=1653776 RepID=UPI00203B7723|nr:lyase family protein [Halalkalibacter oceani]MCM3761442.1 lyase family protein [Halalkalibacter oceani]
MANHTRMEVDSFGSITLPATTLYGIHTYRAINNLSFSQKLLRFYPAYISALVEVKKTAALTNRDAQIIPKEFVEPILSACNDILKGTHHEYFQIDLLHGGGGFATNMNINEVISNLANLKLGGEIGRYSPIHPIDHVNASQSTSDVCHTASRIALIRMFHPLQRDIEKTIHTLHAKAVEFAEVTTVARTCLQDAMQVKLGETFSGYEAMLTRRLCSLIEAVNKLYDINLGGTVIGSGVGAPKRYRELVVANLREVTQMPLQHRQNLFDAAQNIDDIAEVSSQLRLMAACLMKLAKDLRLLSSGPEAGLGEILLPAVQAGSSFFPGKVNPVIPETLIQCCFQIIGIDEIVQETLKHGELNLNVFEGAAITNLFDGLNMLQRALCTFRENGLKELRANHQRCEEFANSFVPKLVSLKEKYGYSAVATLMKEKGREEIRRCFQGGDYIDKID